jgi:muconolactone delta-isomerase
MKFLVFTRPIDGIGDKLPLPEEFEAQIEWVRQQLSSGRFDCAYHGRDHAVAIVNAESPEALEQFYSSMPLVELTSREVEPLGDLLEQMNQGLESLRKFHARGS